MPKLLTKKEAENIAAKMADEYGLSCRIAIDNYNGNYDTGLKCEIGRVIKQPPVEWFPWFKEDVFKKIRDFYANDFEDLLSKLQGELSRFDARVKVAENFRSKYEMEEADQVLDKALRSR